MVKNLIKYDSLSLSAYMYVLHCFYSVMSVHMWACFLARCGGGDSHGSGGVCVWGGGGGGNFSNFCQRCATETSQI